MTEELIERARALREECRKGVEDRGVMPDYVDACVHLNHLAPKLLTLAESLSARVAELEGVLKDAREALELGATVPPLDIRNRGEVVSLGERIGYGALMATASVEWRSRLGELAGSEFCAGPCRSTAEKVIERIDAALTKEAVVDG